MIFKQIEKDNFSFEKACILFEMAQNTTTHNGEAAITLPRFLDFSMQNNLFLPTKKQHFMNNVPFYVTLKFLIKYLLRKNTKTLMIFLQEIEKKN